MIFCIRSLFIIKLLTPTEHRANGIAVIWTNAALPEMLLLVSFIKFVDLLWSYELSSLAHSWEIFQKSLCVAGQDASASVDGILLSDSEGNQHSILLLVLPISSRHEKITDKPHKQGYCDFSARGCSCGWCQRQVPHVMCKHCEKCRQGRWRSVGLLTVWEVNYKDKPLLESYLIMAVKRAAHSLVEYIYCDQDLSLIQLFCSTF